MADIINAASGYATGSLDTATTLVNNVSPTDAKHINYPAGAIIQIETILGSGTTLKGSAADLATRLGIGIGADGKLALATDAAITGPLNVAKGGTGVATFADGAVLIGNVTGTVQALALPTKTKVLVHTGTAAADPAWGSGLLYQAPSSIASGSTRSLETFASATGNLSGIHFYDGDFTLNSGHTLTVPAGKRRVIIVANGTITINGTITAASAGATGADAVGAIGTDQAGGGGSSTSGGAAMCNGITLQAGAAAAGNATQLTASDIPYLGMMFNVFGGAAGGGNGAGGAGGNGGGSIVLIAPVIVLANTAVLNTSAGTGSAAGGGGGGGGAGNIYMACRSYTDNGATFTMTAGQHGQAGTTGDGAAGVKQIHVYA